MGRAAAAPANDVSFEAALERLEAIVAELESGELALERALAAFEEGVALSRRCASQLEAAERRIEVLMAGGPEGAPEGARTEPFAPGDERDPGSADATD